jgi:hypothetical protein
MRTLAFLALALLTPAAWARKPLTQKLDIHTRPNWDPNTMQATGVLCLTTGVGIRGSGVEGLGANIGHSALSIFDIEGDQVGEKNPESYHVTSIGFWPDKTHDRGEEEGPETWQVDDRPGDHFMTFASSTLYGKKNSRHCIEITTAEKKKIREFLETKKQQKWTPAYNCNDLSVEAFFGVLYGWKPLKELKKDPQAKVFFGSAKQWFDILLPHYVRAGTVKFQKQFDIKGTLSYTPRSKDEIAKTQELEDTGRITVPLFKETYAEIPVIEEKVAPLPPAFRHKSQN